MALEQRIASLQKRKADLNAQILAETSRPLPDDDALRRLKVEKLGINDSIERLLHLTGQQQAA